MTAIQKREFYLHKYGRNPDVDAGGEDVWDAGGAYEWPLVAFETSIIGGSNDIVGSAGVHGVQIEGLDINGIDITEVATLTGAAAVVLVNSYYRVNRAFVLSTGGNDTNSWDISITHTGSATLSQINAQEGQTLQAIYTLPANVSGHLTEWYLDAGQEALFNNVRGCARLQVRGVNGTSAAFLTKGSVGFTHNNPIRRRFGLPTSASRVPGFSDIRIRITAVNTDNVAVNAGFELKGHRNL